VAVGEKGMRADDSRPAVDAGCWLPAASRRLPVGGRRLLAPIHPARILVFTILVVAVISLVPALTEMVFAIGAGDRLVAVSSYDDDPPEVRSLPKVGALIDPDVERIITLRPDLVLLYGSQADLMTQLTRASIPYFEYRHSGLIGVTGTIRALGKRLGKVSEANAVVTSIDTRLAAVRQRTVHLRQRWPRVPSRHARGRRWRQRLRRRENRVGRGVN
jgi:ABC-type hemin transport system substrate-binding protein